jgi:hypothetical protein
VLDFDQGRTYALQIPQAEKRAAALTALAQCVPKTAPERLISDLTFHWIAFRRRMNQAKYHGLIAQSELDKAQWLR